MTSIGEREQAALPLRQVVATWLSTATGGAERSMAALTTGLASVVGLVVSLIWWDYDGHGPRRPTRWTASKCFE